MAEVERAPRIPVSEDIRGLLCKIAYGWLPVPIEVGRIQQLDYDGTDLSECTSELSLCDDRMQVLINAHVGMDFPQGEIRGVLFNGMAFKASMILNLSQGSSFEIEAGQWSIFGQDAPRFWIGQVEGMTKLNFSGNLCVERIKYGIRVGNKRHFFLTGAYDYFFVQCDHAKEVTWQLIIDTRGAGVPEPEAWARDFLILQFVLGRQMRLPMLIGVTDDFRTVAATVGNTKWGQVSKSCFPPVPLERNNTEFIKKSWAAVLFERISATWRNNAAMDNAFAIALEMYLDAMNHHLDFDYLRLQVALESVAFWILKHQGGEEPKIVRDEKKWEDWVKKNEAEIRSHACDGFEDNLYLNVKKIWRLPSGRVIRTAFERLGMSLIGDMNNEMKGRNDIVHQGLMAPGGYEIDRDLRRVAIVRTMLVALIAKASGYGGAINGWELGLHGRPLEAPAEWWRTLDEDQALASQSYFAEEVIPGSLPKM